jgi:hypothetical protein
VTNRRALLLSPLYFVVALLTLAGLGTSPAAANAGPETRVRAFDTPVETSVAATSSETPASIGRLRPETVATAVGSCVATEAARGVSKHGGIIEQTGTNAAGGRVFTSTGAIDQTDFAGIVNSGLLRGDDVHIFTGTHGLPDGSLVADAGLLAQDVRAFGSLPGVHIYDLPSMTPAEVQAVLNGPGTIIGGFCDSGACLAPFTG